MKKAIQTFLQIILLCFTASAQKMVLVKDKLIHEVSTDSMNYIYSQKMIPFKDSGVVVISYADSVISSGEQHRVIVNAFDKNLNTIWSIKLPFSSSIASISIDKDEEDYVYVTYYEGSSNSINLVKISPTGNIVYNKDISSQITSNTLFIINKVKIYFDRVLVVGNIFITQKSFTPALALLDKNGDLVRKEVLTPSISSSAGDLYKCSLLTITKENNIAFTYQSDTLGNYGICCYDSLLNPVWNKTFNIILGRNYNLFCQDNNVVFFNKTSLSNGFEIFKYNSKTGTPITPILNTLDNFTDVSSVLILPTKKGNYLLFGNYSTTGGFDNFIDYFDENSVITSVLSASENSRNSIGAACIIGNNIYTVSVRYVDMYCYPQLTSGYRGMLKIAKFQTDFLNLNSSISYLKNTQNTIQVYPNPTTDKLYITSYKFQNLNFKITDLSGRIIHHGEVLNNEINTHFLSSGLYFITLFNEENNAVENLKFIKE